jgi:hypothetical protein
MADFTASTGLRDIIAANLEASYYWLTLHGSDQTFVAGDTYTAGVRGELATGAGYTRGAKSVTLTNTNGVLDGANATWTTGAGETLGPVSFCALWINTTNTVTGAKLVSVDDSSASPQTASNGGTMTAGITNPITIPTPA